MQAPMQSNRQGPDEVAQSTQTVFGSAHCAESQAGSQVPVANTQNSSDAQSLWSSHWPGGASTQAATQSSHPGQEPVAQSSQILPVGQPSHSLPQTSAHSPVDQRHTAVGGQGASWLQPTVPLDVELLDVLPPEEVVPELVLLEPPLPPPSTMVVPPQAAATKSTSVAPAP